MIRINRPGTLECDRCHHCWITHPALMAMHPSRFGLRVVHVEDWARRNGWTATTETGHLCPRCTRSTE